MKRKDELKHYGVLGMKWGIWNDETRDRYNRGKEINSYQNSQYAKLQKDYRKNDKELLRLRKEYENLAKKYGFDDLGVDDVESENINKYSEREIQRARNRERDLNDKIYNRAIEVDASAIAATRDSVIKKYGRTAYEDLQTFRNLRTINNGIAYVGIMLGAAYTGRMLASL